MIIGKINLGSILEKLGNFDFSDEKIGFADMYMSATNIWLLDGIDGHHYISDNNDMYETAWSYLDPQYGWIREKLEKNEAMMDKSKRGSCLNSILEHTINLGCDINNMEIVFLSDNTVYITMSDLEIIKFSA